jgi:hypothetical protein
VPEDGEELSDLNAAAAEAKIIARDFAKNRLPSEFKELAIVVTDETGAEVFRVLIS